MKLEYTAPELIVTRFETEDIITASNVDASAGLKNVDNNTNAGNYDDIFA